MEEVGTTTTTTGGGSVLSHKRLWKIPKESELRIETKGSFFFPFFLSSLIVRRFTGGAVFVTLQGRPEGSTAEVFGTELPPRVRVELYHGKGAVYSWTGCEARGVPFDWGFHWGDFVEEGRLTRA